MTRRVISCSFIAAILIFFLLNFISCGPHFGQIMISAPDEYKKTFEAKEKFILKAVAAILQEKNMGTNVKIRPKENMVETDYIIQDDWRIKSIARVKRLNWRECELVLSVITEKKTENGWEMRRLLEQDQYDTLFFVIETQIYEEMGKIDQD